jgi:hypothetical protein
VLWWEHVLMKQLQRKIRTEFTESERINSLSNISNSLFRIQTIIGHCYCPPICLLVCFWLTAHEVAASAIIKLVFTSWPVLVSELIPGCV